MILIWAFRAPTEKVGSASGYPFQSLLFVPHNKGFPLLSLTQLNAQDK